VKVRTNLRFAAGRVLALSLVVPAAVVAVPEGAGAAGTVTTVTAVSEQGDTIGGGGSFVWRPGLGSITATRDEQGRVVVSTSGGGVDAFTFTLAGPGGADLAVGDYTDARDLASATAVQPRLEITAGGRTCLTSAGHFSVSDFAPDLSHLLIHYESGCGGGRPALFGELRVNMPTGSGPLVTPSAIVWPDAVPLEGGARGVPVYVVNNGGTLYNFGGSGSDQPDFTTSFNNCGTLVPGNSTSSSCSTLIGFNPQVYGPRTGTFTIRFSGIEQTVGLSGVGAPPIEVGKPPDAVVYPTVQPGLELVGLRWINPKNLDWTETIVRGAAGATPPATINDGVEVYRGQGDTAVARNLQSGTQYAFSMFARDAEGMVAPPATIAVTGTKVTLSVDKAKAVWGRTVMLRGKVTDAQSGAPVAANHLVRLQILDAKGNATNVDDAITETDGTFTYPVKATQTGDYVATFSDDFVHIGSKSAKAHIKVSSLVTLKAAKASVARGKTIVLTATAKPIDRGKEIVFEQQVKGKWKPVAKVKPDRTGVATTKIKASKVGKATYRAKRTGAGGAGAGAGKPVTVKVT
jgi:hypothetical protein